MFPIRTTYGGISMTFRLFSTAIVMMLLASSFVNAEVFDCTGGDVDCLNNAILTANANGEDDTINLEAGAYTLLEAPLPSITSDITINGAGADSTAIIRDDAAPLFLIFVITDTGIAKIDGLTIRGGGGGGLLEGGAINNRDGGVVTVTNSVITDNDAGDFGGAIDNRGTMTIINSTISNNTSFGAGGIANRPQGTLVMVDSTVSGNSSRSAGGGIAAQGTTVLLNTTISNNNGGGIYVQGTTMLLNTTVSNNDATEGGGIFVTSCCRPKQFGAVELKNSVVANNTGDDCFISIEGAEITSLDFNLDSDGSCNLIQPNDLPNTDPVLGPLADNGGPTDTHALLVGSPAIDAGEVVCTDPSGAPLTTDQRGEPRPVDGNSDGNTACDIGAFEFQVGLLDVGIDIKPGNKRNVINTRSKGGVWVAILSDTNAGSPFDPSSQVDIRTVEFGPDGAKAKRYKVKDINKDGLGDLLLRFKIPETGISCGDTDATLTGETFDGQSFTGTDFIKTVGCKPKKCHKKKHHKKHHHHEKHHWMRHGKYHDDDCDDDKEHHKRHYSKHHDDDHKKR
jgi:predicted outer membrane repeat protein